MNTKSKNIRVRFAPSPTGPLHMGGVRTALYNYLFAKKNRGKFILRIEDTDQKRFVDGAEKYILDSLRWCGLDPDEGPNMGGRYGPYRQSERKHIYWDFVKQLIDSGNAYYAFDTPKDLEEMRDKMKAAGVPSPTYNSITRSNMKNSLTLPSEEVKDRIDSGEKYVVRIKMPRDKEIKLNDSIRGWVSVNTNNVDDKVLFKSDGMPTYHLANVVDDFKMQITHVIRGEEWLPSAPLHIYLYKVLGWEDDMPTFAHLPLILKPEGNGKLSKRDGDRLGFPVFPIDWYSNKENQLFSGYREMGFLKGAFINMLALLGWNPGTEKEIFILEDLVQQFTLDRVGRSGAKYDYNKTKWFNQQHLRLIPDEDILNRAPSKFRAMLGSHDQRYKLKAISLLKDRATFIDDIFLEGEYFFSDSFSYSEVAVKKKWHGEFASHLQRIGECLSNIDEFQEKNIELCFKAYIVENRVPMGKIMPMLRIATTGNMAGPSLFSILELLGKDRVINRINRATKSI